MKNYKITVNGTTYDVTVEDGAGGSSAPVAAAPVAAAPAPAAAAPAAPKASSGSAGSVTVNSPMPGKILSDGQSVSKGDVLMVLEAMKMENEIVAPSDGTVASINVSEGASVEAGDLLASLN